MSGYECVWSLGDLFIPLVECSATNSSFCQALNRENCEFTPNTCGRCFECYTPDGDDQHHACSPMQAGLPLPAPTLQTTGAVNAIGPAGLGATSLRVRFLGLGSGWCNADWSVVSPAQQHPTHPDPTPTPPRLPPVPAPRCASPSKTVSRYRPSSYGCARVRASGARPTKARRWVQRVGTGHGHDARGCGPPCLGRVGGWVGVGGWEGGGSFGRGACFATGATGAALSAWCCPTPLVPLRLTAIVTACYLFPPARPTGGLLQHCR